MTGAVRRLISIGCVLACVIACNPTATESGTSAPPASGDLRIVTLAPHLAELAFAVGAGDQLIGVSAYTDYPEAATLLPVVGDAFNLDQERLTLLEADLLLAWDTGTPAHVVDELRNRGYSVEVVTTTTLADIPDALLKIGRLTGNEDSAAAVAEQFNTGLAGIAAAAESAQPISVFYQVDARPLYTINGAHFLSELIALCGGSNIFSDLGSLAPLVSVEAVLERNPEVMLASSDAGDLAFEVWDRWENLAANRYQNRFLMPAADIGRPTTRLLTGAQAVCDALREGRANRARQ